jgi:hypothetical protein
MQALTRGATYTGNPQRTTCVARGGILSLASGRVALIGQVLAHYIQYRNQQNMQIARRPICTHFWFALALSGRQRTLWRQAHSCQATSACETRTSSSRHSPHMRCQMACLMPSPATPVCPSLPWAHTTASAHLGTCKHTQHISVTHARILCNPPL